MADKKISALTAATTPLAGTEVLPIVQSSTTKQVSVANLTAGRAVSADSLTLTGSPLPTTSGGTGLTSFTANGVVYASSTSALATGSGFKYDGTNVMINAAPSRDNLNVQYKQLFYNSAGDGAANTVIGQIRSQVRNYGGNIATASFASIQFATDSSAWYKGEIRFLTNGTDGTDGEGTQQLTIGSSGNVTVNTGNLIQGTAAKGVDFSANTPAAGKTSTLLNWYEEGTWTPQVYYQNGTDQTNSTNVTQVGNYTRVGNLVSVTCYLTWTITGSPANDNVGIKNLPFTIKNSANYYPVAAAILGGADTNPTYGGWLIQGQPNTKVALIVTGINGENQGNEVGATGTKSLFFTMSYLV